jgi:hypothetical protein
VIPGEGHLHNRSPLGHDATPSQRQRGRDDLPQDVVGFYGMFCGMVIVFMFFFNNKKLNKPNMKISFYPMVRREQFGARGIHIPNKNGNIMHKELLRVSKSFPTT